MEGGFLYLAMVLKRADGTEAKPMKITLEDKKYLEKIQAERNVNSSTMKGYVSTVKKYMGFNKMHLKELLEEASYEEEMHIPMRERKIKKRLLDYRTALLSSTMTSSGISTYFSRIKTLYGHFEIEVPSLPVAKYPKGYESNYLDLPTREDIMKAIEICDIQLKAIILFQASSGTASAEALSLTVQQFIDATKEYHHGGSLPQILDELSEQRNIVPIFYLNRIKTDKHYFTFCTPEASLSIVKALQSRLSFEELTGGSKLFPFKKHKLLTSYQEINDKFNWGFKGKFRFFRSHTLRKFHASNIGLTAEYIDMLEGRSRNSVHETYIKADPTKLKKIYMNAMGNVTISDEWRGGGLSSSKPVVSATVESQSVDDTLTSMTIKQLRVLSRSLQNQEITHGDVTIHFGLGDVTINFDEGM